MGHDQDYWERVRRWLFPKLGVFAQLLEGLTGDFYYVESETHNNEFVGRVPMNEEEFEETLHEMGFTRNPLAALKSYYGETEEGSWRRVENGSEMQLHLILYDGEKMPDAGDAGYTYLYAHWEYRWDVHPWKHYQIVNKDTGEGVRRMKKLLDEHGVGYEPIRP